MDQATFKATLVYIYDGFNTEPTNYEDEGGQFQPSRYFQVKKYHLFWNIPFNKQRFSS